MDTTISHSKRKSAIMKIKLYLLICTIIYASVFFVFVTLYDGYHEIATLFMMIIYYLFLFIFGVGLLCSFLSLVLLQKRETVVFTGLLRLIHMMIASVCLFGSLQCFVDFLGFQKSNDFGMNLVRVFLMISFFSSGVFLSLLVIDRCLRLKGMYSIVKQRGEYGVGVGGNGSWFGEPYALPSGFSNPLQDELENGGMSGGNLGTSLTAD